MKPLVIADPKQVECVYDTAAEGALYRQRKGLIDGILEDGHAKIFMPATFRLFNSYEFAQLMRFWIAINWMRDAWDGGGKGRRTVVDFGCSHSKLYQMWYANGNYMNWPAIHYIGIDGDEKHLRAGRQECLLRHKSSDVITHVIGDISRPMVLPWKVDVCVSMETFEHIPKAKLKYLFESFDRNLTKRGTVIISGENPDRKAGETGVYKGSHEHHHYEWPYDEVIALAVKCGFELVPDHFTTFHAKRSYHENREIQDRSGRNAKWVYERLKHALPTSIVNNLACMLDTGNLFNGRQWMMALRRK